MDRTVIVDPRWRFGFPSIGGISTDAVVGMHVAGEDLATIAHEYDLTPLEILRALWFEGRHGERPGWREWAYAAGPALGRGEVVEPPDPGAGGQGPNSDATDDELVDLLLVAAAASTCSRGKVGAVAFRRGGHPLSATANGPLRTDPRCDHRCDCSPAGSGGQCRPGCASLARRRDAVHAEMWILADLARSGVATDGLTVASTTAPCYRCAQLMAAAGVAEVLYVEEFREPDGLEILKRAGVLVRKLVLPVPTEETR